MTLDEYLDSGIGIESLDYQVRLLSGCPELDVARHPAGGRISAPPVEPRHLELAKRNIEQHFIAAAPMEAFNSLLLVLRAAYGWKLWQILFMRHNIGERGRLRRVEPISTASRRRLEEMNRFDLQLYDWVKVRFAEQTRAMEPELSRDLRRFELLNAAAQRVRRTTPALVARPIGRLLSPRPEPDCRGTHKRRRKRLMPTMSPPRMITRNCASTKSLAESAGRAWVQGLARTTVGGKVLRAAYESYFEAAAGHQRMFRGLYADFAVGRRRRASREAGRLRRRRHGDPARAYAAFHFSERLCGLVLAQSPNP